MRWLRTAARLAVVAFPRRQHLLHRLGHRQRRIEVLVLDDRRLVDLPDLVEHPVGQDMAPMADLEPAIRILAHIDPLARQRRSEEHTSELQSLMSISYAVVCLKTQKN